MEYEVIDTQHQTYGSASGIREVVVFTVVYTAADFTNTAYLEFSAESTDAEIAAGIAEHGRTLASKGEKTYSFAKSGIIE